MHPVADEGLHPGVAFRLRNLILVVGENQVLPAAMDVQSLSQVFQGHGTTLNMPARSALPPGAIPGWLPGLSCLPQDKVHRVLFCFTRVNAGTGFHLLQGPVRKLAVIGHLPHPEIDATLGRISIAFLHEPLHKFNNLRYCISRPRRFVRRHDIQSFHVFLKTGSVLLRQLPRRNAQSVRPVDNLVINIGDILDRLDLIALVLQIAADDIKDDVAHGVANMALVVGGDPADIHPHFAAGW